MKILSFQCSWCITKSCHLCWTSFLTTMQFISGVLIMHTMHTMHTLFFCYLLNHLLCLVCCDPEEKQLSVTWIDNAFIMKQNPRCFAKFILDNLEEYIKIKELLDEKKKKLLPHETLHSYLDEIPMSLHKELADDKYCVIRVSQRGYQCRNCIHHNMILLEIIHRPKCWKSFTPDVYISTPVKVGPIREYIYYIDLKNGIATMGWESCSVVYNMRL